MKTEEFTAFREKMFPGKMSKEKMGIEFGVKYNTLRRYEGSKPLPIPEVLAKSIGFYEQVQILKGIIKNGEA